MFNTQNFTNKQVRTVWNNEKKKFYFVISDIVKTLTKTQNPKEYTKKLRKYDKELAKVWDQFVSLVEVKTNGGRQYMNCASALGIARIIQSIRSPKTRIFRNWINSLNLDFNDLNNKTIITNDSLKEFYSILENPRNWKEKFKAFSSRKKTDPLLRKMNKLESIFSMIEENAIITKKKKIIKKKMRLTNAKPHVGLLHVTNIKMKK
jgi:hypothetical protein